MDVGGKITTTLIFLTFSPHFIKLALLPVYRWMRRRNANKALIQGDAKKALKGPVFLLMPRYASAIAMCYFAMFFSSGIPIFYLLISICMFGKYIVDKYMLIRYCSKPPAIDSTLNNWVARVLPFAVLIHTIFAVLMYSVQSIFPDNPFSGFNITDQPARVLYGIGSGSGSNSRWLEEAP